jgi:phage baseplate assembly protein gpV
VELIGWSVHRFRVGVARAQGVIVSAQRVIVSAQRVIVSAPVVPAHFYILAGC